MVGPAAGRWLISIMADPLAGVWGGDAGAV
jgi:hypothetical protein